jgi:hypothetical protein
MSALEEFMPEVWHAEGWPPMLVCGRRWMHSLPIKGASVSTTFDRIVHAVAIQLAENPVVCIPHESGTDSDVEWHRGSPEDFGLHPRAAGLALAEAWRCVDIKLDPLTFSGHLHGDFKRLASYRGGTPRRNIAIWLAWGRWQRDRFTFEQRLAEIDQWGFGMKPKAFRSMLEKAGMSI